MSYEDYRISELLKANEYLSDRVSELEKENKQLSAALAEHNTPVELPIAVYNWIVRCEMTDSVTKLFNHLDIREYENSYLGGERPISDFFFGENSHDNGDLFERVMRAWLYGTIVIENKVWVIQSKGNPERYLSYFTLKYSTSEAYCLWTTEEEETIQFESEEAAEKLNALLEEKGKVKAVSI